jgi:hypothetical protein
LRFQTVRNELKRPAALLHEQVDGLLFQAQVGAAQVLSQKLGSFGIVIAVCLEKGLAVRACRVDLKLPEKR